MITKYATKHYEFHDAKAQALALAGQVADDLSGLLQTKEQVSLCVPGGSTPSLFFNALSQFDLEWQRVRVLLTDERWVPLDHPMSNEAQLRTQFVRNVATKVEVISFFDATQPIDSAVETFNQALEHVLPVDICVLGMGDDGHTASLFPDMHGLQSALNGQLPPALLPARIPNKQELRVSLNLSALLTAQRHYLLIKGSAKQAVILQASEKLNPKLPISYVLAACSVAVYYSEQ
ncbi:MAG: 6-phosphogluconolactonase [Arenicella sp.]